jgi:hypothetical protein
MKELIELSFWDTHIQSRFLIICKMAMKYATSAGSSLSPPTPERKNSFLLPNLFLFFIYVYIYIYGIKGPRTEPSSYRGIGSDFVHNLNLLLTPRTLTGARSSWNFITVSLRAGKKVCLLWKGGGSKTSFLGSFSTLFSSSCSVLLFVVMTERSRWTWLK